MIKYHFVNQGTYTKNGNEYWQKRVDKRLCLF